MVDGDGPAVCGRGVFACTNRRRRPIGDNLSTLSMYSQGNRTADVNIRYLDALQHYVSYWLIYYH